MDKHEGKCCSHMATDPSSLLPCAGEERQLSRGEHSQAFCGEQTLHSLTQPYAFVWSPTGSFYVLLHQRGLKVRETHVGLLSGPKEGAKSGEAAEKWWGASKKRATTTVELGNTPGTEALAALNCFLAFVVDLEGPSPTFLYKCRDNSFRS